MLLRTENISKQFNGIYALSEISMEIAAGEVHGLVGENGAGKSTLIKLLTGVYSLDEGQIYWNDEPIKITGPAEARAVGINVIHQDHVLIPAFGAVENIYLGLDYPQRGGRIDWTAMRETVQARARELGVTLDLKRTASQMSPPQKTCVEIVRAMMTDCRLLILDEPTASLTDRESEILFAIIERLKRRGTSVLYVTHRMDEIFRLTDRVTVFRNGKNAGTVMTREVTKDGLIAMMTDEGQGNPEREAVGNGCEKQAAGVDSRDADSEAGCDRKIVAPSAGPVMLRVEKLASADGIVRAASFEAHRGEILGIFGLGGSGRTELLECIYGYRAAKSGVVELNGVPFERRMPSASIRRGMVLISEDRRGKAMTGNMSVRKNITLPCVDSFAKCGVLNQKRERESASQEAQSLQIRCAGIDQRAAELSGGNQQKMVFARALMTQPAVFLCDEPTQAVDVRTRGEIHRLLRSRADAGSAVVYVSSDLMELLEVADNILIMSRGRTKELLKNEGLTSTEVLACCYDEQVKAAEG